VSYPILYSATETNFDHNGIGILSACVSCEVTEEANGAFELAMTYPMDGVHFAEIGDRTIIKAKADQFREPQLFRVYAISKPMNGIVTVLSEHISYDLSGIPVKTFSAENASQALSGLKSNAVVDCRFVFWTDKETSASFNVSTPSSIRSRLGGVDGSILDVYGGELEFDNFTVKLHNSRGQNRGVSIRYGKNLTDIKQDQNCSNVATGIYPYWYLGTDAGNVLIDLPEKIVPAPGTYNFVKIRTLDLSSEFETQPTVEQLRAKAESYIRNNNIGVPVVSLSVSFEQLSKSEEYKHLALLERVSLFDTVNVEFPALGVSATAKAVKMVYDVLADRVKIVTLGSVRANIADTIATQQQEIEKKPSKTFMQTAIESLTKTILGAKGGSVRLLDEDGDGEPDTLYIADNPNPMQAVKVWRFNYEGWGASKNGYSGPYEMGATFSDGIVADFITAGTLYGILFKAGIIESLDGKININLDGEERQAKFNSGIVSNDLSIKPIDAESPLFNVRDWRFNNPDWNGAYLEVVGFYDDGSPMFKIASRSSENDPATEQNQRGVDFTLSSKNSSVTMSNGNFGSMLSVEENGAGVLFFGKYFEDDRAVLQIPGTTDPTDRFMKYLDWEWDEDKGQYYLIGKDPTE
jgi:phage minor structural protein